MSLLLRKALCFLMCILLLLPFAVMGASALGNEEVYVDSEVVTMLRYPVDGISSAYKTSAFSARRFASSSPVAGETFTFYTLLDAKEKEMYNSILSQRAGLDCTPRGHVKVTFSENKFSNSNKNQLVLAVKKSLLFVLSALKEDHPELFFIWGYSDLTLTTSDFTFQNLVFTLNSFTFDVYENTDAYPGWASVESNYNMLLDAVANFKVTGNTRYEKVKSIHDSICNRVNYDMDVNDETKRNPKDFDPTSVFCEPYLTVCEGYSEALKMICDREGIPCITVVGDGGGPHKWAYVQMEDGKWYGMDVTWDDQEGVMMYDFFLSGSETKNVFFDGNSFASLHVPTGEMFVNAKCLTYPELSATSYVGAICAPNNKSTFDVPASRMFISKNAELNEQLVATSKYAEYMPDDHTVTVSGETTGASVTITTVNDKTKDYTVIRWGDINADNSVDSDDYSEIHSVLDGSGEIVGETPSFYAADFYGDGVIDAFDLYYLDAYLNDCIDR